MDDSVMRYLSIIIISLLLLPGFPAIANAEHERRNVTPYGDFCPQCTKYGTCKSSMSHDEARKAMIDYYHKKGLGVEIEHKKGRFIKAKIKDSDKVVDVIIFDRKTGRVRSTY
jgi:hypothetical protein